MVKLFFNLNYQVLPFLNISFYDYYNPLSDAENKFWKYKGDEMRHSLELTADFEKDEFPLTPLAGVFIYGDKDSIDSGERFSTYIEPNYNFKIAEKEFRLFAGFSPFADIMPETSLSSTLELLFTILLPSPKNSNYLLKSHSAPIHQPAKPGLLLGLQ